jgi:hypothetical protein
MEVDVLLLAARRAAGLQQPSWRMRSSDCHRRARSGSMDLAVVASARYM